MAYDTWQVSGSNTRIETDAVKLFCGKMGKDCADAAMQVFGGNGYVGEYQVERLWRDAKLLEIGGGTNEVTSPALTSPHWLSALIAVCLPRFSD